MASNNPVYSSSQNNYYIQVHVLYNVYTQFQVLHVSGLTVIAGVIQVTILWSPPLESNGVIVAYELRSNGSGSLNYINTTDTYHTLRNLPPNTVVAFSVRAYTIIGPGEYVTGQATTDLAPVCLIQPSNSVGPSKS